MRTIASDDCTRGQVRELLQNEQVLRLGRVLGVFGFAVNVDARSDDQYYLLLAADRTGARLDRETIVSHVFIARQHEEKSLCTRALSLWSLHE